MSMKIFCVSAVMKLFIIYNLFIYLSGPRQPHGQPSCDIGDKPPNIPEDFSGNIFVPIINKKGDLPADSKATPILGCSGANPVSYTHLTLPTILLV